MKNDRVLLFFTIVALFLIPGGDSRGCEHSSFSVNFSGTPPPLPAKGQGILTIQNLMAEDLTLSVQEGERVIYFSLSKETPLSMTVRSGDRVSLFLKKGTYSLRWVGEPGEYTVKIKEGKGSSVSFSTNRDISIVVTHPDGKVATSGMIRRDPVLALERERIRHLEEENRRLRERDLREEEERTSFGFTLIIERRPPPPPPPPVIVYFPRRRIDSFPLSPPPPFYPPHRHYRYYRTAPSPYFYPYPCPRRRW